MKRIALVAGLCAGVLIAQTGITPPRVGLFRDAQRNLRPLDGLGGSFLTGPPAASGALRAAYSGRCGWIKTADRLVLLDEAALPIREWRAPGGEAWFGFSRDGSEALAYLPETGAMVVWRGHAASVVTLDAAQLAGEVVSAGIAPRRRVALAVRRDNIIWRLLFSPVTGVLEEEDLLPGVTAPLLLLADGRLVFARAGELVVRAPDGSERSVGTGAAVAALAQLGEGWLHVTPAGEGRPPLALRLTGGEPELYRIPEVAP